MTLKEFFEEPEKELEELKDKLKEMLESGDLNIIKTNPTIICNIVDVRLGPDRDCIVVEVFE